MKTRSLDSSPNRFGRAVMSGASRAQGGAVGDIGGTIAAGLAAAVTEYGPDLVNSAWDGITNALGFDDCSGDNQAKWRRVIDAMSVDELTQAMVSRAVRGRDPRDGETKTATGNCLRYALRYVAKRLADLARQEQAARAGAEAAAERSHPTRQACMVAVDAALDRAGVRDPVRRDLRREVQGRCERFPANEECVAPAEALLVGVGSDGFCLMTVAQREELLAKVRAAGLTPAQRAQLESLPFAMRRAAFVEMVGGGMANGMGPIDTEGGSVGWGLALLALLGGGLWWFKRKPAKTKEGR